MQVENLLSLFFEIMNRHLVSISYMLFFCITYYLLEIVSLH